MADGTSPDITQQLLQMQSMISSAAGNGAKGLPIFAGIVPGGARDVDVGAPLSTKGKGLNSDGMINKLPQGKPGLLASLKQQMGLTGNQMFDDIAKVAKGAGVMYTGNVTNGTPVSSGGLFADNSGPSVGGGMSV